MSTRIPMLAKRVKENPEDSFSKFALALELLKMNEISKARFLFENIVKQDHDYVGVYYHLGGLYASIEENNLAISTYKKGIEIATTLQDQHAKNELMGALATLELELL